MRANLRVGDLGVRELGQRLEHPGLAVVIGPFAARLRIDVASIVDPLRTLYRDYAVTDMDRVSSFHVDLTEQRSMLWRPKRVRFSVDGRAAHEDQPLEHALPTLEWGINLVVAMRFHCFLMLHAGVVERGGRAMLLPALPGHGKTTLCAAMTHRGWRLLSDEFGLLRPGTLDMIPIPRPMPLKNESIAVVEHFAPDAVLGPVARNTRKGDVSHVKAPTDSILRSGEKARAKWIVFPQWIGGEPTALEPVLKSEAFLLLATNAFNYETLGEAAFATASALIDECACYKLVYSDLEDAIRRLDALADHAPD